MGLKPEFDLQLSPLEPPLHPLLGVTGLETSQLFPQEGAAIGCLGVLSLISGQGPFLLAFFFPSFSEGEVRNGVRELGVRVEIHGRTTDTLYSKSWGRSRQEPAS